MTLKRPNGRVDHCRIGSLEMELEKVLDRIKDHCRIGSLETWFENGVGIDARSLPHRQLRNGAVLLTHSKL